MATKLQDKPERRGCRASLSHAFFRWESAVTIALTILLAFLLPLLFSSGWQWWYWLVLCVLGAGAETLLILTSLSDETGPQVVSQRPRQAFDARVLRDRKLREQVEKALEYRQYLDVLVQPSGAGMLRDATAGVSDWVAHVFEVARRLDAYRSSGISQKRASWEDQQQLRETMDEAELRLENTLAALGAAYAQLQLVDAGAVDRGQAQRLRGGIAGQIASLLGTIEAIDEVYTSRAG